MSKSMAILFPGQGSQRKGMLAGLLQKHPAVVKQVMRDFEEALGLSSDPLIAADSSNYDIDATEFAQPAILATSIAYWRVWLKEEVLSPHQSVRITALGHSVGEYSALVAAGLISLNEGLALVRSRGLAIARAVKELNRPFGMWVLVLRAGASCDEAIKILSAAADPESSAISAINSNNQIVISGYCDSLAQMVEALEQRRPNLLANYRPLAHVSAPFHSPLLRQAAGSFGAEVDQRLKNRTRMMHEPIERIISNLDGKPGYLDGTVKGNLLAEHVVRTVMWQPSIDWCLKEGIQEFCQMGPGTALHNLLQRRIGLPSNLQSQAFV